MYELIYKLIFISNSRLFLAFIVYLSLYIYYVYGLKLVEKIIGPILELEPKASASWRKKEVKNKLFVED